MQIYQNCHTANKLNLRDLLKRPLKFFSRRKFLRLFRLPTYALIISYFSSPYITCEFRVMKNTIFYLSTCSTCTRIIKEIAPDNIFKMQDIKKVTVTKQQLTELREMVRSYEALFNRKAIKYRSLGLQHKALEESDYERLILNDYTFLKRPVIVFRNRIFIGNSKNVIQDFMQFRKG